MKNKPSPRPELAPTPTLAPAPHIQQTLWSQLSSLQRRQLAQQLAHLIRRRWEQTGQLQEGKYD